MSMPTALHSHAVTEAWPTLTPDHFGISVPDLDASIDWYSSMFGFRLEMREFIAVIPAHVAFLRLEGMRIELFQVEGGHPLPPERRDPNLDVRTHGNKHMCYRVVNVAAMVARLRERGADIVFSKTIHNTPMAFIRDNAGNLIELIQRDDM